MVRRGRPRQFGPSVIAAHVDSHLGPAVFYRLGALKKGAKVWSSARTAPPPRSSSTASRGYPKAQFPTSEVYATPADAPSYGSSPAGADQRSGHYVDNIVAFAHLRSSR